MSIEYPDGATPLDPDEMEGLKFKHVTTRGQLDHLEQANIQEGLAWLGRHKDKDIQAMNVRRDHYIKALRAADGGNLEPLMRFVSSK